MKFTSRVQPFVSVTQKEASALEMEQKLDKITRRNDIDSHLKMRLYQDGLARLINFRKLHDLKDEHSEPTQPPSFVNQHPSQSLASHSAPSFDDLITHSTQANSLENLSTAADYSHSHEDLRNFVPEPLEPGPYLPPFTDTVTPVKKSQTQSLKSKKKTKSQTPQAKTVSEKKELTPRTQTKVNKVQKDLSVPSYMQPLRQSRRFKGNGGSTRLFVRAWK